MLLPLRNLRQRQQADCLVACAAMVLDYLGIDTTYEWLLRLLGTAEPGTPFSNLERLCTLNLFVRCEYYGTLTLLEEYLDLGLPVVVAVEAWALPHWKHVETHHAVVVVGVDEENIYLNDPFFAEFPLSAPIDHFLGAWAGHNEQFAIISLIEPG